MKDIPIAFEKKATVCKYVVPKDYGLPKDQTHEQPAASKIEVLNKNDEVKIYYSSVDKRKDGLYMTSSRAIGIVGIADTVGVAEKMAENAISSIKGPVDHRADIGTAHVIERRIAHMKAIRG
ncbi:MAG: hypothetical protein M0P57_06275 [Syntrophales bacterium]|nr:hypothetical protein [Syntrophales bacterium]